MNKMILILLLLLMTSGCAQQNGGDIPMPTEDQTQTEVVEKAKYIKISPEEAKEKMAVAGTLVVDVRTQEEFAEGHIQGALLLPVDQIEAQAATVLPDKDAVILVYCRSGNRSRTASEALIDMGYTQVLDFGGIIDWPFETVK